MTLRWPARHARAIAGGFTVMLLASGPTFLVVGLAAKLHGRTSVAYAALAFLAVSLLAPRLARGSNGAVCRRRSSGRRSAR